MQLAEETNCLMIGNCLAESHVYRAKVEPIKGHKKCILVPQKERLKRDIIITNLTLTQDGTQTAQALLLMYGGLKEKKKTNVPL